MPKTAGASKDRLELIAIVLFLSASLFLAFYGKGERSGWIKVSQLWCTAFGYNYAIGDQPFYMENVSFIHQVKMFLGAKVGHSIYSARPLYSFMASLMSPFMGMINSFLAVNYIAWAASAFLAWRFAFKLFGDKLAAFISTLFVLGGFGFIFHIGDYSPHLMSFLAYYLGIVFIYESRVWLEKSPLKTHLFLGCYLGLAYLCYDIGVSLIIGYIAVAVWRNRWLHVLAGALIALIAKPLWLIFLPVFTWLYYGQLNWANYYGFESNMLLGGVSHWLKWFASDPARVLNITLETLIQFFFFECPLIIILGMISWAATPSCRKLLWFLIVFFSLPILGGMVFAFGGANTRGYLVYGVSLLLYVPIAGLLARNMRATLLRRTFAVIILALIICCQFFWSTEHFRNHLGPAFSYIMGLPAKMGDRFFEGIQFMSLTGSEPTPVMFGGMGTLKDAGLYIPPIKFSHIGYNTGFALLARIFPTVYAAGLVIFGLSSARLRKAGICATVVGLWLIPAVAPSISKVPEPFINQNSVYPIPETGVHIRYIVRLSGDFVDALKKYEDEPVIAQFQFGMAFSDNLRIMAGDVEIPVKVTTSYANYPVFYADLKELLRALRHSGNHLTVEIPKEDRHGTSAFGWQRQGLPNRRFIDAATGVDWPSPNIPAFEVRIVEKNNLEAILLAGF